MHRVTILFLLLVTAALVAVTTLAQEPLPTGEVIPLPSDIFPQIVSGETWRPLKLEPVDPSQVDFNSVVGGIINPAADHCSSAPVLTLAPPFLAGAGQTLVNTFTVSDTDPVLSCMFGNPPPPRGRRGYRTAWYQFTAPITGHIIVSAEPNAEHRENYDTVIGVFSGSCDSLTMIACNDDAEGLLSVARPLVQAGQTYYIEIADWRLGTDKDAILNLLAIVDPTEAESFWEVVETPEMIPDYTETTRHVAVGVGTDFYLIGGQLGNTEFGLPILTPVVNRYNTVSGEWSETGEYTPMPGDQISFGYSNSTAVYKDGLIFMPSGFVGDFNIYDGTHFIFDPDEPSGFGPLGEWMIGPPVPWPNDEALGYVSAAPDLYTSGYYVTGGIDGAVLTTTSTVYDNVWFYDITVPTTGNGVWRPRPAMNTARYAHIADFLPTIPGTTQRKLCVAGGITHEDDLAILLAAAECLNFTTGTWEPIDDLNIPRFNAGSAVSPDGLWYIFGGTAADGTAIATTEVYDPANPQLGWQVLDYRYDLTPPRSWPRGGFVGETLWIFNGEVPPDGEVVPLVEKIDLSSVGFEAQMPLMFASAPSQDAGDTFLDANQLLLNVPESHRFVGDDDFFDTFYFDIEVEQAVTVVLSSIPSNANYDLEVYNTIKGLAGFSYHPEFGHEEAARMALEPGRYYILVIRAFPLNPPLPDDDYVILVEG